ncbi:MAG: hypothetical protein ACTHJ0_04870 [Flavipsychrobacter sp.]
MAVKKQRHTRKQALNISKEYQNIVGKLYLSKDQVMEVIEAVTIAPYDKKNKSTFVEKYKIYRDTEKAISFYEGVDYDVVVFTNCPDGICCRDLDKFTDGEGILQHN